MAKSSFPMMSSASGGKFKAFLWLVAIILGVMIIRDPIGSAHVVSSVVRSFVAFVRSL